MNLLESYTDAIILPGSVLNPGRYSLPSQSVRLPLDMPSFEELPPFYSLPELDESLEMDLPGLGIEEELLLDTIPRPFVETVRYIHSGITPNFSNGVVLLDGHAKDIHHIVKRSYVKADKQLARELLPFNGAIKGTYDLLTDVDSGNYTYRIGGRGHMLLNLIPLEYHFHHSFVEGRAYAHPLELRIGNKRIRYTIPELLMGLNIFNLRLRFNILINHIENGLNECVKTIEETQEPKLKATKQYQLYSWQQMQIEAIRIPMAAEEIEEEHPDLFEIWRLALGETQPVSLIRDLEQ